MKALNLSDTTWETQCDFLSMTYSEKLKSPKWQKKRLEILSRDKFKCQECGSEENTLHIHHKYYEANKDPWEYEDDVFISLCEDCHKFEEFCKSNFKDITKMLLERGYTYKMLSNYLYGLSTPSDFSHEERVSLSRDAAYNDDVIRHIKEYHEKKKEIDPSYLPF